MPAANSRNLNVQQLSRLLSCHRMVLQFLVVNPTISAALAILHYEHLLIQVEWVIKLPTHDAVWIHSHTFLNIPTRIQWVRPIALVSVLVAVEALINLCVPKRAFFDLARVS